jgi:hypothetical protein
LSRLNKPLAHRRRGRILMHEARADSGLGDEGVVGREAQPVPIRPYAPQRPLAWRAICPARKLTCIVSSRRPELHPLGYRTASGTASPKRRDNADETAIDCRDPRRSRHDGEEKLGQDAVARRVEALESTAKSGVLRSDETPSKLPPNVTVEPLYFDIVI